MKIAAAKADAILVSVHSRTVALHCRLPLLSLSVVLFCSSFFLRSCLPHSSSSLVSALKLACRICLIMGPSDTRVSFRSPLLTSTFSRVPEQSRPATQTHTLTNVLPLPVNGSSPTAPLSLSLFVCVSVCVCVCVSRIVPYVPPPSRCAKATLPEDGPEQLLVTSDQVISYEGTIREKPADEDACRAYLSSYEQHPACTVSQSPAIHPCSCSYVVS